MQASWNNSAMLVGRMVKDPIFKETDKSTVILFTLAVDNDYAPFDAGFYDVVAFANKSSKGYNAIMNNYANTNLGKGDLVKVDGVLRPRQITVGDKSITTLQFVAQSCRALQPKGQRPSQRGKTVDGAAAPAGVSEQEVNDVMAAAMAATATAPQPAPQPTAAIEIPEPTPDALDVPGLFD